MTTISPEPEVIVTAVVQGNGAESSPSHQGDTTILGKTALWQA